MLFVEKAVLFVPYPWQPSSVQGNTLMKAQDSTTWKGWQFIGCVCLLPKNHFFFMVLAVGQLVSIGVYADRSVHLNPIESLRHGPQQVLETGNSTVTPVVSNLRIHPALVDGYLPFAHFFLSSYLLDSSVVQSIYLHAYLPSCPRIPRARMW